MKEGCEAVIGMEDYAQFMKAKQEKDKHRHHKQPQFYLKGFGVKPSYQYADVSDIWVYKKDILEGNNPRLESIKDVGYAPDFYAFEEENGSTNYNKYEYLLMREFEQLATSIIKKIRTFEEIQNTEKSVLSKYISSMMIRGNFGQKIFFDARINAQLELSRDLAFRGYNEIVIREASKQIVSIHEKERKSERDRIRMIEIAKKYADLVNKLCWQFFVAPNDCKFMTSDNPVRWNDLETNQAWVLFTISSKVCLVATQNPYPIHSNWKEIANEFWEIDNEAFEGISEEIVRHAFFEVYYSKKSAYFVEFVNNRLN